MSAGRDAADIVHVITNPSVLVAAVGNGVKEFRAADSYGRSQMLGSLAGHVTTAVLGGEIADIRSASTAADAVGGINEVRAFGAAESEVASSSKIAGLAGDLESHLGPGFTKIESPTGNSIFRSADGTKQIRFDLNDFHGDPNGPHINLETWAPKNLYPGDPRMQQIENLHIYPKGP